MTYKLEQTKILSKMLSKEGLEFRSENGWNTIAEHIEVHRENLNHELKQNVSWDDALFSWYENIYTPLNRVVDSWSIKRSFPGQTGGDLYLAVSDHWFYMKENNKNIMAEDAAFNFFHTNKAPLSSSFSRLFKGSRVKGIDKKKAA